MAKHAQEPETSAEVGLDDLDAKLKALEEAEKAVDSAYTTGRVERAKITQMAQLDAAEAVAMAGVAMESDIEADEAMRISVIAEKSGDHEKAKEARAKMKDARKAANRDHKAATESARKAFNAIKFSAPNKMGFMRFVQIIFAAHIVYILFGLLLTSRDTMVYSSHTIITWIMIVLEGIAFWLFVNRYKIGRPFVIGMAIFGIAAPAIHGIVAGDFSFFELFTNGSFFVFLIFYFALSKRVKATLVNDFSHGKSEYDKADFNVNRKGWPFIRNLIMYFFIFSVVGHWMEAAMCQLIKMGLVEGGYDPTNTMLWRDWLYPFPMEGMAVVIIALALYPLLQKMKREIKIPLVPYVISFVLNGLVCGAIEFIAGLLVNANHELWDYSDQAFNIMGQVCLQNVLAFAAAASIITWFVYPLLEMLISRVRTDVMNIIFVAVTVFGCSLFSLYIIDPPGNHQGEVAVAETKAEKEYNNMMFSMDLISGSLNALDSDLDNAEALEPTKAKETIAQMRELLNELKSNLGGQASAAHKQAETEAKEMAAAEKAEKEAERDQWAADQEAKKAEEAEKKAEEAEKQAA